jgi:hypothetical protein
VGLLLKAATAETGPRGRVAGDSGRAGRSSGLQGCQAGSESSVIP